MKCKICGGQILFQNGIFVCQNCSSSFSPENIYENIDVYLCYTEADITGRRTKDSLIAQELYNKLESAKIKVFYERISTDGITGDLLEATKLSAMQQSRVVIILGTNAEYFVNLSEKYSTLLYNKTIIPFCIDVNPKDIPQNISKIQAISYNTIGWEKDLVNGLYNLLGKESDVSLSSIYSNTKKKKTLVIAILSIVVALGIISALVLGFANQNNNSDPQSGNEQTSQQATYDQAISLLNQGKLTDSLKLFLQIPDHPDSANQIKLIYSKYEGFYQKDNFSIHLDISNNTVADIEVNISTNKTPLHFSINTNFVADTISCDFQDNLQQNGKLIIKLEDTGFKVTYNIDGKPATKDLFFELSKKSDKNINQIDADIILGWLKKKYTFSQIKSQGYELEEFEVLDRASSNIIYKIKDTDIYLHMYSFVIVENGIADEYNEKHLLGVTAPAEILISDYVGKRSVPFYVNDVLYWPLTYALDSYSGYSNLPENTTITKSTNIGVTSKAVVPEWRWNSLRTNVAEILAQIEAQKKYVSTSHEFISHSVAENQTDILVAVDISNDQVAWYKYAKKDQNVKFIREGLYKIANNKISEDLWFNEYLDFAFEFPDTFDIKPGTPEWDEKVSDALMGRISQDFCKRYNLDQYQVISYVMITENTSSILTAIKIDDNTCAWYKAGKSDGSITFVKEGPIGSTFFDYISEDFWNNQYPEFASEFPNAFQY